MKIVDATRLATTVAGLKEEAERCDFPDMVHALNIVLILIDNMAEEVSDDGEE